MEIQAIVNSNKSNRAVTITIPVANGTIAGLVALDGEAAVTSALLEKRKTDVANRVRTFLDKGGDVAKVNEVVQAFRWSVKATLSTPAIDPVSAVLRGVKSGEIDLEAFIAQLKIAKTAAPTPAPAAQK